MMPDQHQPTGPEVVRALEAVLPLVDAGHLEENAALLARLAGPEITADDPGWSTLALVVAAWAKHGLGASASMTEAQRAALWDGLRWAVEFTRARPVVFAKEIDERLKALLRFLRDSRRRLDPADPLLHHMLAQAAAALTASRPALLPNRVADLERNLADLRPTAATAALAAGIAAAPAPVAVPMLYIALVGGQPMPTLLGLVRDGRGRHPTAPRYPSDLLLVHSSGTTGERNNLIAALPIELDAELANQLPYDARPWPHNEGRRLATFGHRFRTRALAVPAYRVEQVRDLLLEEAVNYLQTSGARVRFDITGATKPMSFGALSAGVALMTAPEYRAYWDRVDLHYVETEEHAYNYPRRDVENSGHQRPESVRWDGAEPFPDAFPELTVAARLAASGYAMIALA